MQDRRMWIIFLIVFVNLLGFGIILPLMPYYVESFGAGAITIGLLSASYSLFQFLSAPILGELSDKIGRRPVLLFSLAGTALSFLLLGVANTLPLLFAARIIDGLSGGNISTAQAYIADITSKENRTQGMGILMAAFSLGFILGPALGGILSQFGYGVPALVAAAVSLLATVLTFFFLPESRDFSKNKAALAKNKKKFFSPKEFYQVLTHPEVGLIVTLSFLVMLAFSLMEGTFALFTEHTIHSTAQQNGYLFAYLGLIGIIIQLFLLRRILAKAAEHTVATVGIFCMMISLGLIAISGSIVGIFVAITFLAFGNSVANPVLSGLVSKLSPEDEQGNILGITQSAASIARLIGPILGTSIYAALGSRMPYVFSCGLLLITGLISARYLRTKPMVSKSSSGSFMGH